MKSFSERKNFWKISKLETGNLFGYVQFDIELPENPREACAKGPPIFKNINVGRDDIGPFMKDYAEKKRIFNST